MRYVATQTIYLDKDYGVEVRLESLPKPGQYIFAVEVEALADLIQVFDAISAAMIAMKQEALELLPAYLKEKA